MKSNVTIKLSLWISGLNANGKVYDFCFICLQSNRKIVAISKTKGFPDVSWNSDLSTAKYLYQLKPISHFVNPPQILFSSLVVLYFGTY